MKKTIVALTLLLTFFVSGCDTDSETKFTVSFDLNSGETLDDVEISPDGVLSLPDDPTQEGYEFKGWYTDEDLTDRFSAKDLVTEDLTLYAKWDIEAYTIRILDFDGNVQQTIIQEYGYELFQLYLYGYDELYMEASTDSELIVDQQLSANTDVYADTSSITGPMLIGANIYTYNDNFMNGLVRPELQRYADEIGMDIEIVDSENDQGRLNDQVDMFIANGASLLLINLVDPSAASTIIQKAKAADIPLIFYGKQPTEQGILDTYDKVWVTAFDNTAGGVEQGEMIAEDWLSGDIIDRNNNGQLDYVLLKGEPGHPVAEARTEYVIRTIEDFDIITYQLDISISTTWNTAEANDTVEAWLDSVFVDEIDVIIANNDGMAFGAIHALQGEGIYLPVYGIDALEEALTMIGDGRMAGTVLLDGEALARATLDMAFSYLEHGDVFEGNDLLSSYDAINKTVSTPYVRISEEDLD